MWPTMAGYTFLHSGTFPRLGEFTPEEIIAIARGWLWRFRISLDDFFVSAKTTEGVSTEISKGASQFDGMSEMEAMAVFAEEFNFVMPSPRKTEPILPPQLDVSLESQTDGIGSIDTPGLNGPELL
jgi:hypothetical protein